MSETATPGVPATSHQSAAMQRVWEAIGSAVRSATHLQVVTMLGDATVTELKDPEGHRKGLDALAVTPPARAISDRVETPDRISCSRK